METFSPESLGVQPPREGFQTGGWYQGRQFWNGTLSQPGVEHPSASSATAGQTVSREVNLASDVTQGNQPGDIEKFLAKQRESAAGVPPAGVPGGVPQGAGVPGGAGIPGGAGVPGGISAPNAINLPELFKSLTASSGIGESETKLSDQEKSFIEAKGQINDNPFLSEATRVGRVAKLEKLFAERTANLRGDIATKKADIEMQLNLETKQFDINSDLAKQGLDMFNSLLNSGALDNASGEDIATLTRSSGISSSMIRSAVQANRAKNVQTSTISFDDGTNQGFAVINSQTGEIISRQNVASSKPKVFAPERETVGERQDADTRQNETNLKGDIQRGANLRDVINAYSVTGSGLSVEDIYRLYNANSPHGTAKESIEQVKEGRFTG